MNKNKNIIIKSKYLLLVLCLFLIVALNIKPAEAVYGGINLIDPVSYPMNAGYLYGEKLSSSSTRGHHGTDWSSPTGSKVVAAYGGKVYSKGDKGTTSYGKYIIIESDHPDYNVKCYHLYAHLSDYSQVTEGQIVSQGQEIASSGESGGVTGPHLHFEIRMGQNSWYNQRNPEGLLIRSTSDGYGGVLGEVRTSSGSWARNKRIHGAQKGTDVNYGASYSYYLMGNGDPFPDESAYGINYYIGRAVAETVTFDYDNGGASQTATIYANTDYKLSEVNLP